jgi:hypothetical protein
MYFPFSIFCVLFVRKCVLCYCHRVSTKYHIISYHLSYQFISYHMSFTSARQLFLSWASLIQTIPPHPTSWRSILILSSYLRLGLPSGLFPPGFPIKIICLYIVGKHQLNDFPHMTELRSRWQHMFFLQNMIPNVSSTEQQNYFPDRRTDRRLAKPRAATHTHVRRCCAHLSVLWRDDSLFTQQPISTAVFEDSLPTSMWHRLQISSFLSHQTNWHNGVRD